MKKHDLSEQENYRIVKEKAVDSGACLFGVCDLESMKGSQPDLSCRSLNGLKYGISIAVRLSDKIIEDIDDRPTKLYFYHYRQVNYLLDRIALMVMNLIQERGYQALPVPSSQTIDWKAQKGHLSHKDVALAAGLGWAGRNNLLVNGRYGSRIRLVTVLTDLPLICDRPLAEDCGECRECLSACPAGAIRENREEFRHLDCYKKLDEFRKICSIGHHICGICVKACKPRRRSVNE